MLVGVLCEVVTAVSAVEKDQIAISKLKSTLLVMLKTLDADGSGDIYKDEIEAILHDETALQVMQDLNINVHWSAM